MSLCVTAAAYVGGLAPGSPNQPLGEDLWVLVKRLVEQRRECRLPIERRREARATDGAADNER